MKPKILFIMHMPPPVHGAAMVGQWIHDHRSWQNQFKKNYFPILYPISDTESYYQSQTGYMLLHSYIRWMGYL